ncbi:catalase [Rubritalea spongiae]|uniref:Catalase n=1 Tax=Rubritalea spongiae TaxID=430797 RepID=A0ABW5E3N1_9BACT
MTPYKLGDQYVKYTLIPTSARKSNKPKPLTDSYLSQNIQSHLKAGEASFDFCVQFFKNDKTTSLKDNMQIWKESDSPYIKVATLTLPKQAVGTQERFEFGENLSYSPAHCLNVHQPIGEINYARLRAYEAMSQFRHGMNEVPINEPSEEDFSRLL